MHLPISSSGPELVLECVEFLVLYHGHILGMISGGPQIGAAEISYRVVVPQVGMKEVGVFRTEGY